MGFGPRVIGDAAYKRRTAATKGRVGFGPRVGGKKAAAEAASTTAGALTGDEGEEGVVGTIGDETAKTGTTEIGMSVEQFKQVLAENPTFLDTLVTQELERAEGARRECLEAARVVAEAAGETETVAELDEAIAALPEVEKTEEEVESATGGEPKGVDLSTLSFADLKKYAKKQKVDVTGIKSKQGIIDALNPPAPPVE